MKENIPCRRCGKERMIDTKKNSIRLYSKRSPRCRRCAIKVPSIRKKISKGWFGKGHIPWSKLNPGLMPTPWNKGVTGHMGANRTSFKYKNGAGYRHLFRRGVLHPICKCGEKNIKRIQVHHRDGDRKNNCVLNLEVLCRPCHLKEHGRNEIHYVEGRKAV